MGEKAERDMEEEEENKAEKRWIRTESTEEGTPAPRCEGPPLPSPGPQHCQLGLSLLRSASHLALDASDHLAVALHGQNQGPLNHR